MTAAYRSLPAALLERAAANPERVALRHKQLGRWKQYTWDDYATRVARIGMGLAALGVQSGDRVAVHSENRPAWVLADLGAQGIGATTVGIYPTSPAAEVRFLLEHSSAVVLIAEDEEQLDKVMSVRHELPALRHIVVIDPRGVHDLDDPAVMTFAELEALGVEHESRFAAAVAEVTTSDIALIVYTSGTTGPPKGAMLSHANLLAAAQSASAQFGVTERDEVLSYLPLCHIAERLISVVDAICSGYVVNFGESSESFPQDMREVQPTFFLGVPRVWEKMLAGVTIGMEDAGFLARWVFRSFTKQGARLASKRWRGQFGVFDRLVYSIGWVVLYRPLRTKLGLRRVTSALSGAAPIAPEVLEFFWSLGVPVREGYGQTENTAQATITPSGDVRIGKVGVAVPGVELRIADDGEILTRGPGVFVGYFNDPAATSEAIDDEGWLHTGDVGTLDDDGFLTITDRKKDIIITAGGKNISPSEIENRLKVSPYVREAIVIGDKRKFLTALIGIEGDTVSNWAARRGLGFTTYGDLASKPEVYELIASCVESANRDLAQVETVKRFALLPKELDQEEGELTATQKVKRKAIAEEFGPLIESLYQPEPAGAA
ncbi:MAG: AMP-dependent synthetase/ligase [Acidimicrobiales bacterium]